MRTVLLIVMMAATPAMACDSDFIVVQDWQVKNIERGSFPGPEADVHYRLTGDKGVRMIDAAIRFEDALGKRIASIAVERDKRLSPGITARLVGFYPGSELSRIPNMEREDVMVTTCTRAVIYDDGTKEEFN